MATHLRDNFAIYRDGSVGGRGNFPKNRSSAYRMRNGQAQGRHDAATILAFITDKDKQLKETVKIISHSMGGSYAKGYVQALLEYFQMYNIPIGAIEFEADFAPFQPEEQEAVSGVDTYQFSHENDKIAGDDRINGTFRYSTGKHNHSITNQLEPHTILSFLNQINNLPAGTYTFVDGKIVPVQ